MFALRMERKLHKMDKIFIQHSLELLIDLLDECMVKESYDATLVDKIYALVVLILHALNEEIEE